MVTLDSGGFSSAGNAIAVDREGHAHICYYHKPSSLIKYASNESGSWAIDTICPGTWMVIPVSIAVDNQSYPHVCTDDNVYATTAPLPAISIRPPAVDFGLVRLGGTKTDSVYLVSTGDTAAVVSDLSFSGANPDDYRVMCDCSTIVPGDSCLVGVMFTPDSVAAGTQHSECTPTHSQVRVFRLRDRGGPSTHHGSRLSMPSSGIPNTAPRFGRPKTGVRHWGGPADREFPRRLRWVGTETRHDGHPDLAGSSGRRAI